MSDASACKTSLLLIPENVSGSWPPLPTNKTADSGLVASQGVQPLAWEPVQGNQLMGTAQAVGYKSIRYVF
jgi:hypothetical protein